MTSATQTELTSSLPVRQTDITKQVVYSQPVEVAEGQVLLVIAEFQVTNDLGKNVLVASQVVLAGGPDQVQGRAVTAPNGENVTPDMHHGEQTKSGAYQVGTGETGLRWVNLVVWAAASQAQFGDELSVDQGYGRLSVLSWPPAG